MRSPVEQPLSNADSDEYGCAPGSRKRKVNQTSSGEGTNKRPEKLAFNAALLEALKQLSVLQFDSNSVSMDNAVDGPAQKGGG